MPTSRNDPSRDDAVQLLELAARLHAARGDSENWIAVLRDCRDWFGCIGALDLGTDGHLTGAGELEALAGRVTHCARYRGGTCGATDELKRARCAALAPHLHEAALAHRRALQAALFDGLPPTWILVNDARVQEANAPARALVLTSDHLSVNNGYLTPGIGGGVNKLRQALGDLSTERCFAWPGPDGAETVLLLRPLAGGATVAATLLAQNCSVTELARWLTNALHLSRRQGDLAARLLAGQALAEAARRMGISRHTANEHLAALLHRTGAENREALVARLLALVQR